LLYFAQPIVLVDIVAVILPLLFATQPSSFWADSTFIPNWLTSSSGLINLRLLRILRLQRVLQDMDTFTKFEMALGISDSNVKAWQLQLARTVLSIFTLLSVSTGLIYTAEHDVNPNIPDYFTALYFGLTTLTTVGFGDITPVSWEGRLVVSGSILAGVAVIPAQAAVLVEALLARQEEQKAAQQARSQAANSETGSSDEDNFLQQADTAVLGASDSNSDSTATLTPTFDPIRQEVAAQAAKRRHTLVHGGTSTATNDNDNIPSGGRMVLETEFACPACGVSMHWSSAKFCWSCGHKM
jgi:voltage-gated potassium channel Kch